MAMYKTTFLKLITSQSSYHVHLIFSIETPSHLHINHGIIFTVKKMSTINRALKVINILKQNGYEGYIVGGAVRDHLLGVPTTDIDITTNAKPYQVAKMFKTIPTGIKYGTVTVQFGSDNFEVTTYRVDGEYQDSRHPEEVSFIATVEDDVKRRDFSINGLLMNEQREIIDYVDGQEDLKKKMIKAIGDPFVRFNEDALRMMRAFYFQAKLGFQIDKQTRDAITSCRHKLNDVANERILAEIIKMFKGPHLKKAIQSLVTTKVHEVLPGLKEGFEFALTLDDMPFVDAFFTMAFTLHGSVPKEWTFSNKHRHRYEMGSYLANQPQPYDPYTLYTYGLDLCLLGHRVAHMLGKTKNYKHQIEEAFKNLPIQSDLDLKLRPQEMIALTQKKAGAWVKNIQTDMVIKVLRGELNNDKNELEAYLLAQVKE
jgi:tRNA nucleotidyltransferase (CCA-adding enzyme)